MQKSSRKIKQLSDSLFIIVCEYSQCALRIQMNHKSINNRGPLLMGTLKDENSLNQIFMIFQVKKKYQIVHFKTDLIFESDEKQIRLEFGRQKNNQLFDIEYSEKNKNYQFRDYNGHYLCLKGTLRLQEFNQQDQSQQFYLKRLRLFQPLLLRNTILLINPQTKLCIDASRIDKIQNKNNLILYNTHYRFNQRWILQYNQQQNNNDINLSYRIKNAFTNYYLNWSQQRQIITQTQDKDYQWKLNNKNQYSTALFNTKKKLNLSVNNNQELFLSPDIKLWRVISFQN